jgi:NTE family protein
VARLQAGMSQLGINPRSAEDKPPAMLDVLATSINIMQVLITRSRLAGDPPDVMISPQLAELGLMEFHRAALAIETGQRAAERALPQLMALVNQSGEA